MKRLLLLLLISCAHVSLSGSNVPTDHTFALTAEDISAANDASCRQEWVTDDPASNVKTAVALLDKRGIRLTERDAARFTTATRYTLRLGKGFWDKPVETQAVVLSHELVHYCQRDALGNDAFELSYLTSSGRWRVEVPAYSQSIITLRVQGMSAAEAGTYIEDRLEKMRDFYWLWDIDQIQYDTETRKAWKAVVE